MWNNRLLRQALQRPMLEGKRALVVGFLIIAVPTLIRAVLDDIVSLAPFLTYVPFVVIGAVLLTPKNAAIVALGCALVADYLFMKPYFSLAAAPDDLFGIGVLLLISAMIIALMTSIRGLLRDTLHPTSDEHAHRVIFSEHQGEAWAHWDGKRPSVKLGPHKKVAEMMEDYVAQVELGERLTNQQRN